MKILVTHSSGFDYQNELYIPLRNSAMNTTHEIILPHESGKQRVNTTEIIQSIDLVIAECSYPSTGQGIELGLAWANKVPVLCVYKTGSVISSALNYVTKDFIEYSDTNDLIDQLTKRLSNN